MGPENWGGIPMDLESDDKPDAIVSAVSDKDLQSPGIDGASHNGIRSIQLKPLDSQVKYACHLESVDQFRTPNGSSRTNLVKQIGEGGFVESDEPEVHTKSGSDSFNEENSTAAGTVTTTTKKKSVNFSSEVLEGRGSKATTLDEVLGSTYNDENDAEDNDYDVDESELIDEGEADGEDLSRKHWNLAKYLPSAAEEYFYYIIGQCTTYN